MTKDLEQHLWDSIQSLDDLDHTRTPRDLISKMVTEGKLSSPKPAWATLAKWSDEGAYDYGVALDLGWRVPGKLPRRLQS